MDACVDPLVLQLEDEDPRVRLATLEKLRKVAAVESAHFPVRNPRRFLQCLRRRAVDDNAAVSREARRLVVDVMPALGDDAEQVLSSILLHLIPHLPSSVPPGVGDEEPSAVLDDEVYRVFRKYVTVYNDLKSVAELLVNTGLAHGRASVREASLVAITRLLDERFLNKRKPGASSSTAASTSASRMDKALFVALLQATVPALEDSDEGVVVAAEETIAKLQLYWGHTFQSEATQFLSSEDNQTLGLHQQHISQFLAATTTTQTSMLPAPTTVLSSSTTSTQSWQQKLGMRSSRARLDVTDANGDSDPSQSRDDGAIMFGFIPSDVMETLSTSRSNSNADWKKRSAAVEKLFQLAKHAVPSRLSEHVSEMDALFATIVRLMQDVDAHIVKRALQTTQLLFSKLLADASNASSDATAVDLFMLRLLHSLVETAACFADDKDVRIMAYAVLSQLFTSNRVDVAQFQHALVANSLQSRRLQVREEALRAWTVLLLSAHDDDHSHSAFERSDNKDQPRSLLLQREALVDEMSIQILGKLLGDTSVRVRDTALETAVVLSSVAQADVYALLETHVDDQYVSERIDWATLRRRLRQKRVPQLAEVLPMISELNVHADVDKSLPGSSELQTMMLLASRTLTEKPGDSASRSPLLLRTSHAAFTVRPSAEHLADSTAHIDGSSVPGVRGSLSDRSSFAGTNRSPREDESAQSSRSTGSHIGSNITNEEMADRLSTLKKKANQLRRTTSVNRVVGASPSPTHREIQGGADSNGVDKQRSSPSRSKTSPERLTQHLADSPDTVHPKSMDYSPRSDVSEGFRSAGLATRRQRPDAAATKHIPISDAHHSAYYQQLSPQKQQDMQTRAVNHEDRPIRSRFIDSEMRTEEPVATPLMGDDRPIRQPADASSLYSGDLDEYPSPTDNNESDGGMPRKKATGTTSAMSLATRKRLEAKQRQEELERQRIQQEQETLETTAKLTKTSNTASLPSEYGDGAGDTPRAAAARPISLATRKRLEAKAKQSGVEPTLSSVASPPLHDGQGDFNSSVNAAKSVHGVMKKAAAQEKRGDEAKPRTTAFGSQEPRYLEPHELTPVANPKQEAASLVSKISRADDWIANFEALTTVRRLAVHSPSFLDDKIHAVVSAILGQVMNLRSTVSKNALLALESMCASLGRALDGEVDAIVPLLLKRSADSNQFVCESASISLASVARHCSTLRVVSALSTHLASRAVPIRREVARCSLTLLSVTAESQQSGAFPSILSVVGKCLEDSNNEVRDMAKQALLFLLVEQHMDVARIKKLLPSGTAHAKLDQLVANKTAFASAMTRPTKASPTSSEPSGGPTSNAPSDNRGSRNAGESTHAASARAVQGGGKSAALDMEAFEQLLKALNSSNWKDRFDALETVSALAASSASALTPSGQVIPLFDVLVKRLDDGNAKVSALALERLGGVLIPELGDGLAPVLGLLLPALSKQLAANNARMASLALDALKALGAHVDARLLCQHLSPLARLGNARVKPVLVDALAQLAAASDEKLQPALTRYVVPLALELLKEAKSEVKDANGRLLAALKGALGVGALQQAASKLNAALQDKLETAIAR